MNLFLFGLPVIVLIILCTGETRAKTCSGRIMCYFSSWAVYRKGAGKLDVEQLDPSLCTHMVYAFIRIVDNQVSFIDPQNDLEENGGRGALKRFVKLKERNPKLKVLIGVGSTSVETFSAMATNSKTRAQFIQSATEFCLSYGFDGLDLDWERPNLGGKTPADVQNFVDLLKEFRQEFDKHGLLLSASVIPAEFAVNQSYNVPLVSKYVHFINVMTYNMHGSWENVTGQNTPLLPSKEHDITSFQQMLNVKACIETWLKKGADPMKMNLGTAMYGRSFTLRNASENGLGAPSSGPGAPGIFTGARGTLGYDEIVYLQNQGGWTVVWDDEQKVPYMYKDDQWVGYDNPESIYLKVKFAQEMGLGGIKVWSVDHDDFNGVSGIKNSLLKTINKTLRNVCYEYKI